MASAEMDFTEYALQVLAGHPPPQRRIPRIDRKALFGTDAHGRSLYLRLSDSHLESRYNSRSSDIYDLRERVLRGLIQKWRDADTEERRLRVARAMGPDARIDQHILIADVLEATGTPRDVVHTLWRTHLAMRIRTLRLYTLSTERLRAELQFAHTHGVDFDIEVDEGGRLLEIARAALQPTTIPQFQRAIELIESLTPSNLTPRRALLSSQALGDRLLPNELVQHIVRALMYGPRPLPS
jgi:hypothetical protein